MRIWGISCNEFLGSPRYRTEKEAQMKAERMTAISGQPWKPKEFILVGDPGITEIMYKSLIKEEIQDGSVG